jgi:tetratricopeptide (TPR) repeat protein
LKPFDTLKNLFQRRFAPATILIILGIAAYANTFAVPLHYDDFDAVRKAPAFTLQHGFSGGVRRVADFTFALNRLVHGELVAGYHAVNLAIHLAAALCLYYVVRLAMAALASSWRLSGNDERYSFLQRFIPFTTAALFVCHPIQTQAVTYIAQRYTSLAGCFYLAALLAYLHARQRGTAAGVWGWGGTSLVMALLAMMSKEIAFTLPLMVGLFEAALFRGRLLRKPLFLLLLVGLLLVIPAQLLSMTEISGPDGLLHGVEQAAREAGHISRHDYFLTQLRVVATYLRLLVLPVNQNLDYDYPLYRSIAAPQVLAALALHLAMAVAALLLAVRSRRRLKEGDLTAGTVMRLAALGIAWFYLALAVESSVIPIRDVINEHRLYLPSGGFLLALASGLGWLVAQKPGARRAGWIFVLLCCLALTSGAIARNRVWGSEVRMWQDVLEKAPNKARAHYNAGYFYARWGMPDKGLPHLIRAIELAADEDICWITLNAAVAQLSAFEGRRPDGATYQAMITAGDLRFKTRWQALNFINLGLAYEYCGNLHLARKNYASAASLNPALDLAWFNVALAAAKQQDKPGFDAAVGRLQTVNPAMAQGAAAIRFMPKNRRF